MVPHLILMLENYFTYTTHGFLNVAAGTIGLSVGLLVLLNNPKSEKNRTFFLMTLSTAVWMFMFGAISLSRDISTAMRFQSMSYFFGVSYIPSCFVLFSVAWLRRQMNSPFIWICFTWSTVVAIPMIFFTDTVVNLQHYSWGWYPYFQPTATGRLYAAVLLVPFFTIAGLLFRNLWIGWKSSVSPQEKKQFRNLLIGSIIAYFGSLDFLTTFRINYYPLGYLFLSIFLSIVAYTIARHQIFDINILIRKFAVIFLIYGFLAAGLIPLSSVIMHRVNPNEIGNVLTFGVLVGLFLSLGPMIYAYLLRHTFWLRGKSATGLTHELKSPLSTIQGAIEVLLSQQKAQPNDPVKTLEYLEIIEKNTNRLELFVNDLLKLAKIQEEDVVLEKSHFDFAGLVQETSEIYSPAARHRNINIEFHRNGAVMLEADRKKIQQAVSNLLSNALKFASSTVDVSLKGATGNILLSVNDDGPGIPAKDLDRVFDRFFQGKHSTKGSGIGLTIAKAWVEAHGGKIWAESEGEGKGTRMNFTLPVS